MTGEERGRANNPVPFGDLEKRLRDPFHYGQEYRLHDLLREAASAIGALRFANEQNRLGLERKLARAEKVIETARKVYNEVYNAASAGENIVGELELLRDTLASYQEEG